MSWPMVKLGDAPLKISDGNYSAKYPKASEFLDSGIPFLSGFNIVDGEINEDGCKYISKELHAELKKGHIKTGDVLITTRGNIGNTAIVPERLDDANINAQLVLLRPETKHIDSSYLKHIFNSPDIKRQIDSGLTGSALKQLPIRSLNEIEIPLPPLAEQKRIAAILDKADAIRRKRQQAIQLADDFLRAVFLEMFGDPVTNPKGWEVRKLGECLQFMTSGSRGWAKYYSEKGSKFIRIMNVGKNKLLLDDIAYVEPPATKEADRTRVEIGDVLLSITADLGRSAVVTKELNGAYINQHLALLRPLSKKINSKYLAAFLSSDMALIQFQAANKSAVKSGLNFTDIREFKVLLPPIELQNRFEDLLIYSEETLEKKKSSINGVDMLFNSLSQKAFSGQL